MKTILLILVMAFAGQMVGQNEQENIERWQSLLADSLISQTDYEYLILGQAELLGLSNIVIDGYVLPEMPIGYDYEGEPQYKTKSDTLIMDYGYLEETNLTFYVDPYGNAMSKEEAEKAWTDYSIQLMSLAILQYAEECYNDSTGCAVFTCYNGMEEFEILDCGNTYIPMGCDYSGKTQYIHKEPTFTGFINWLKERK